MDYALLNSHKRICKESYDSAKKAISLHKNDKAKQYIIMAQDSCNYILSHTLDSEERERYKSFKIKLNNLYDSFDKQPISETGDLGDSKEPKKNVPVHSDPPVPIEKLLAELDSFIGLRGVKEQVHQLVDQIQVFQYRNKHHIKVPEMGYHMVFAGSSGTGKTTIARLFAKICYSLGLVSKGQLVEVKRDDLVAEYIGQTAVKTQEVINRAIGGILFIDEAYGLVKGGNDFGHEAIETILVAMEKKRDDLIVITAGYDELMDKFIHSNPGLPSRFKRIIHFDDYSPNELCEIFEKFCKDNEYELSGAAKVKLLDCCSSLYNNRDEDFGNAREIRKCFEETICRQASRIKTIISKRNLSYEETIEILPEDLAY